MKNISTKIVSNLMVGLLLFSLFFSINFAFGESAQTTDTCDADASVSEADPTANFGSSNSLTILDATGSGDDERSFVIETDAIENLPADAVITDAKLRVFVYYGTVGDPFTAYIHRVTGSWEESTITWNNQPGYDGTATDSITIGSGNTYWTEFDVTSDVQDFFSGAETNYGWVMKTAETSSTQHSTTFRSRNAGDHRPYLLINFTTNTIIEPQNATNVEETTADLNAYLYIANTTSECGFWVSNVTPVDSSPLQNISAGSYSGSSPVTAAIASLSAGELYYVKAWRNNTYGFYNSTNETLFLTKPYAPSNLHVVSSNATNVTLSWTKASVSVSNETTMIRYSTSDYPSTITDGLLGYNGTAETYTIEGLTVDTTYYFSAWTHVNASDLFGVSDDAATTSTHTAGGLYNITIRYENNLSLVDPTNTKFLNSRCWAETMEGVRLAYTDTFTTNPFQIETTESPVIFFDWANQSIIRSLIPSTGERNVTIYISDKPLYNSSIDLNDSQVIYTFQFEDYTPNSIFLVSPESKLYIFLYNSTSKYYIDQSYFSAEDTVKVALEYGKRYWIGLECDSLSIPFLQYVDTSEYQTITVNILYDTNQSNVISDFAVMNLTWDSGGNGMFVNYTDYATATNSATISIYKTDGANGSKVLVNSYTFYTSSTSYHFTNAMGCANYTYYVEIEVDHQLISENGTLQGILFYTEMGNGTSITWLNGAFDEVLGSSPIPGVRWIDLFSFFLAFLFLVSFGQINGNVALMGSGLSIIFLQVGIGAFTAAMSFVAMSVGVAMLLFGLVFMYGGK